MSEQPVINIEVKGLTELETKLKAMGRKLEDYMARATQEASKDILFKTRGLKLYPPKTEANQPGRYSLVTHKPMGYYQRGTGWRYPLYSKGEVRGYGKSGSSEKLGTQWHIDKYQGGAKIYNDTTYAEYVHGEKQSALHAARGWLKLKETFQKNIGKIKQVLEAWVQKAIVDTRLK